MELFELTIHELHEKLKKREVSSVEATKSLLARIEAVEDKVNAFITVTPEEALQSAEAADKRIAAGEMDILTGIPIALKDIFLTKGIRTTCASRILENFIPPYDATAVAKLKERGAVLVGKLNQDEFAMGSSTRIERLRPDPQPLGPRLHPRRLLRRLGGGNRRPGGNRDARHRHRRLHPPARLPLRLRRAETDLRPGLPLRRDRLCLVARPGRAGDPRCDRLRHHARRRGRLRSQGLHQRRPAGPRLPAALVSDVKGLKIGLPKEYFIPGLDPDVKKAMDEAIAAYTGLGAEFREITLPHTDYAVATYYLIATAEASSNLARYDGVRFGHRTTEAKSLIEMYTKSRDEGFGAEVKRRIMLGTYALSSGYYDAYYLKAQKVRTLIMQDFIRAFEEVDVILTPVAPTPAFRIGEKANDPLQMYLSDIFTIPVNLAGTCGISVPAGFSGRRAPHRPPADRQAVRRGDHSPRGLRLRAGNGVA